MFNDGILLCCGERGTAPGSRINKITGGPAQSDDLQQMFYFPAQPDPELTGGKWPQEMA